MTVSVTGELASRQAADVGKQDDNRKRRRHHGFKTTFLVSSRAASQVKHVDAVVLKIQEEWG